MAKKPYSRTGEVILTLLAYHHPNPLTDRYLGKILGLSLSDIYKYTHRLKKVNEDIKDVSDKRPHKWALTSKGWIKLHLKKYIALRVDEWQCDRCGQTYEELPPRVLIDDTYERFCPNEKCSPDVLEVSAKKYIVWRSTKPEFEAIFHLAPERLKSEQSRRRIN